ncbi:aldose 1-epimerase [Hoeflea sp. G2-23]|uniref:Aldose 1-epimerase n=1 Tax=Hoeflea algicola TaxID=2983763 RepID=A0ABT3ZED3_9HYPH|nr:aldose 1-epimerase [Hoeflea algicola]MCY0150160.1 aldose 1-epimerase [Hoeflea algicola]
MSAPVRIAAGDLSLDLRPELGGSVSSFRLDSGPGPFDLMRPLAAPEGAAPHALHSGMFPMVPFANSIRDNAFRFDGARYSISPNMPDTRLNYHGSGWQLPWRVARHDASRVDLVLEDATVDDVYLFAARQTFALTPHTLTVELAVENRSERTMPFSCGLHPWFPRHRGAMVRFSAGWYWAEDAEGHATTLTAPEDDTDFGDWNAPPTIYQNKCFTDWNGVAEVLWPDAGILLRMRGDPLMNHLMFHVPPNGAPVFCLEPQTNAPCAFDDLERGVVNKGVHLLAPGQDLSVSCRFEVRTDLPLNQT